MMANKKETGEPLEIPEPAKEPEIKPVADPNEPATPKEAPNRIPVENPFETRPNEFPSPGETC